MIYTVALGDYTYYNWAVNLAISCKVHSRLPITLICDGKQLPDNESTLFDRIIIADKKHYTDSIGEFQPGKFKLYLYEYFDQANNLYIDADSILINDVESIIDKCKEQSIGLQVVRRYNQDSNGWECLWMQWDNLFKHYKLPKTFNIVEINSSIIYSKKNKTAESFWEKAQANYLEGYQTIWAKKFPDELAFDVAVAQSPKLKYEIDGCGLNTPVSMTSKDNGQRLTVEQLKQRCSVLSFWGGYSHEESWHYNNYDLLANAYNKQILGRQNHYKHHFLMKNKLVQQANLRLFKPRFR